jgi:hypothetical protein
MYLDMQIRLSSRRACAGRKASTVARSTTQKIPSVTIEDFFVAFRARLDGAGEAT